MAWTLLLRSLLHSIDLKCFQLMYLLSNSSLCIQQMFCCNYYSLKIFLWIFKIRNMCCNYSFPLLLRGELQLPSCSVVVCVNVLQFWWICSREQYVDAKLRQKEQGIFYSKVSSEWGIFQCQSCAWRNPRRNPGEYFSILWSKTLGSYFHWKVWTKYRSPWDNGFTRTMPLWYYIP